MEDIVSITSALLPKEMRFGIFHDGRIGGRKCGVVILQFFGDLHLRQVVALLQIPNVLVYSQEPDVGIRLGSYS